MIKHSELPWIVSCDGRVRSKPVKDKWFDDYICAMPFSSIRESDEMPEANANADFIVRACNSHYGLVEACRQIYNISQTQPIGWSQLDLGMDKMAELLKQALAKAGEK